MPIVRLPRPRPLAVIVLLGFAAISTGCATGGDHAVDVHILPQGRGLTLGYLKKFPHAYAGQGTFASDDVVLVDESDPALTQYLDVRELWSPMKNIQLDAPSSANSTVDWYVVARNRGGGVTGLLRYTGSGYARVTEASDGGRLVSFSSVNLHVAVKQGDVADPIGPSVLSAAFGARTDEAAFADAKRAIDVAVQAAGTPSTAQPADGGRR